LPAARVLDHALLRPLGLRTVLLPLALL
jgi:hypothetical protein